MGAYATTLALPFGRSPVSRGRSRAPVRSVPQRVPAGPVLNSTRYIPPPQRGISR